ncbi:galactokinase [Alicyclobacillus contaminans]|uniref:galactokinase n=1 Tax=Alicyclobacillus contaminans TaxID=392016 RepID=UPI000403A2F5|nr:galactokinase [Alicyclobacillus contaminans]GMA50972.1 galactokinase [Alicyclobacillus contaminans]
MHDGNNVLSQFLDFSPGPVDEVRVFFAPGRVNLIGEHTDYNGGHVFPGALTLGTWVFVRPRRDPVYRFASTAFPLQVRVDGPAFQYRAEDDYANYPKGVLWALQEEGLQLPGADLFFHGNLPGGAGLSSSASVEVATAFAMNALVGGGLSTERLARLSQRAENEFVGVNCGIMDQFAVAMGQAGSALLLNCRTLKYRAVPVRAPGYRFVITHTNKRRGLADSKYNERRAECEAALAQLRTVRKDLTCLADLSKEEWNALAWHLKDDVLQRRARHVVTENARTLEAARRLAAGDLPGFGQLMNESHISLRDDYEVTGPELDALVEAAWQTEGCLGSRMTGAGFGGCTVSLVRETAVERFQDEVARQYERATGLAPTFYVTDLGAGVREVTAEIEGLYMMGEGKIES